MTGLLRVLGGMMELWGKNSILRDLELCGELRVGKRKARWLTTGY